MSLKKSVAVLSGAALAAPAALALTAQPAAAGNYACTTWHFGPTWSEALGNTGPNSNDTRLQSEAATWHRSAFQSACFPTNGYAAAAVSYTYEWKSGGWQPCGSSVSNGGTPDTDGFAQTLSSCVPSGGNFGKSKARNLHKIWDSGVNTTGELGATYP